jgi:hypothetical protein
VIVDLKAQSERPETQRNREDRDSQWKETVSEDSREFLRSCHVISLQFTPVGHSPSDAAIWRVIQYGISSPSLEEMVERSQQITSETSNRNIAW